MKPKQVLERYRIDRDDNTRIKYTKMAEILDELVKKIPNSIPKIYSIIQTEKYITIDMEKIDGKTIGELVKDRDNLAAIEIYRIIKSVVLSIGALHKGGYCHNNLLSDNIIVTKDFKTKLIGFDTITKFDVGNEDILDIKLYIVRLMFRDIPLGLSGDETFKSAADYKGRNLDLSQNLMGWLYDILNIFDSMIK